MNKTCIVCGKEFRTKNSHFSIRKTCSMKCRSVILKKAFAGAGNPNFGKSAGYVKHLEKVVHVTAKCIICGKEFRTKNSHIERRKTCSVECRNKRFESNNRGEGNPNWRGGVAKWKYTSDWPQIMNRIRKRDNYTCQICGKQFPTKSKILHVHHIDGDKLNNSPDNLVSVCQPCHPLGEKRMRDFAMSRNRI